jgi:drug/metabolite transporter (DMT)-like permease
MLKSSMAYLFGLLATALYGMTNFIEKYILDKKVSDPNVVMVLSCFMNGFLGLILFIFFPQFRINNIGQSLLLLISGALMIVYILPYLKALYLEDTSLIIPLFQLISVFTLIFEAIFFGQFLSIRQILGMVIIILSGLMLGNTHILQILKPRKTFWLMMLSCFLVSFCFIIFKGVSENIGFWKSVTYNLLGGGLTGVVLCLLPRNRALLKKIDYRSIWLIFLADDLIDAIARFCYFYATTFTMVTLVQLIGATQGYFVLIYGIILTLLFPKIIKEDIRWKTIKNKLLVGVVMFAGLWLVYF